MRILLLTDRFHPEVRASAHLFHELGADLVRRGHQVGVVTRMPGDYLAPGGAHTISVPVSARETVDGMEVIRVRGLSATSRFPLIRAVDHLTVGLTFALAARRWPRADVLLIYSPPLPLALAGRLYRRWTGTPYVVNLHDFYPQTAIELGLLRNGLAIRVALWLERLAYRNARHFVVPAPRSADILITAKGVDSRKVSFVPNWVDLEHERPGARDNEFRWTHGLVHKFIVSYAGVLGFAQDLTAVLDAARRLEPYKDIVFLLVGDGVYLERWKQMAAGLSNVRFLPMQTKKAYFDLLRASDVCLVPLTPALDSPAIPGKIQSIMAVARPVLGIVNPCSDAADVIAKSQCGVAVRPDRPDEVACQVIHLYEDRSLGDAFGANGRRYAEQHFSLASAAAAYEAILQGVVEGDRRRRVSTA